MLHARGIWKSDKESFTASYFPSMEDIRSYLAPMFAYQMATSYDHDPHVEVENEKHFESLLQNGVFKRAESVMAMLPRASSDLDLEIPAIHEVPWLASPVRIEFFGGDIKSWAHHKPGSAQIFELRHLDGIKSIAWHNYSEVIMRAIEGMEFPRDCHNFHSTTQISVSYDPQLYYDHCLAGVRAIQDQDRGALIWEAMKQIQILKNLELIDDSNYLSKLSLQIEEKYFKFAEHTGAHQRLEAGNILQIDDFTRDMTIIDGGLFSGRNSADIKLSGNAPENAIIEIGVIDDHGNMVIPWHQSAIAVDGRWETSVEVEVQGNWLYPVARIAGQSNSEVRTENSFAVGLTFVWSEQSNAAFVMKHNLTTHDNSTPGEVLDHTAFQYFEITNRDKQDDSGATVSRRFFSDEASNGVKEMASILTRNSDIKVMMLADVQPGVPQYATLDEGDPRRSWSAVEELFEAGSADGSGIGAFFATHTNGVKDNSDPMVWASFLSETFLGRDAVSGEKIPLSESRYDRAWYEVAPGLLTGETKLVVSTGQWGGVWKSDEIAFEDSRFMSTKETRDYLAERFPDQVIASYDHHIAYVKGGNNSHFDGARENGILERAGGLMVEVLRMAGVLNFELPVINEVTWSGESVRIGFSGGDITTWAHQNTGDTKIVGFQYLDGSNAAAWLEDGDVIVKAPDGLTFSGDSRIFYNATKSGVSFDPNYYHENHIADHRPIVDVGVAGWEGVQLQMPFDMEAINRFNTLPPPLLEIDGKPYEIEGNWLDSGDFGHAEIVDGGNGVTISRNGWKTVELPASITENTVLSFDFSSETLGEIHAIGFARNDGRSVGDIADTTFHLAGTQDWGLDASGTDYEIGSGIRRYEIPVGKHLAGQDFDRIVFIADDDSSEAGDSTFANITLMDGTPTPVQPEGLEIGSESHAVLDGRVERNDFGDYILLSDGSALTVWNNGWKVVQTPVEITADTVLSFDFSAETLGEIHGIGFASSDALAPESFFALAGSQTHYGFQDYHGLYEAGSGPRRYDIAVGEFLAGESFDRIVFVADDDRHAAGDSTFADVALSAMPLATGLTIGTESHAVLDGRVTDNDFGDYVLSPDGSALTVWNNGWKVVQTPVEITADTVMSFDFSAETLGEIHGIGFASSDALAPESFFALAGSQTHYGFQDYHGLYEAGSGPRRYDIAVGEFLAGESFDRIVFVADDDRHAAGDSSFADISIA